MKKVLVELNEKEFEMIIAFRQIFMNENEVIEVDHIDKYNYEEYIGKTVKVIGDVYLGGLGLTKIPINFTEVGGSFYCCDNKLTSLEGAPEKVGSDFYCSNNQLTTLEGCPKEVGGGFYCYKNKLTSLVGAPTKVGGRFACYNNKLTSLEGAPKYVGGSFDCSNNQLDIPTFIGGEFEY
ncbi:MAG: hypothetical protein GX241_07490 [Ruminococcaceae bacterium]|nr:hypothetical protein [Oscillospiraceae bacterium]